MGGYALTDRGSWIYIKGIKGDHRLLVEGDDRLKNQYGVILVSQRRHPHVKANEGQTFIDWILAEEGQGAIGAYELAGEQVYFPNAER